MVITLPKVPKGKVQLNVVISKRTYNELIKLVEAMYGRKYGNVSKAVERALTLWIEIYKMKYRPES